MLAILPNAVARHRLDGSKVRAKFASPATPRSSPPPRPPATRVRATGCLPRLRSPNRSPSPPRSARSTPAARFYMVRVRRARRQPRRRCGSKRSRSRAMPSRAARSSRSMRSFVGSIRRTHRSPPARSRRQSCRVKSSITRATCSPNWFADRLDTDEILTLEADPAMIRRRVHQSARHLARRGRVADAKRLASASGLTS